MPRSVVPNESLSSTKLRKHITTMSTVLNLNDPDMDQLADFLGHVILILMVMEQGRLNKFKGKGLDQM